MFATVSRREWFISALLLAAQPVVATARGGEICFEVLGTARGASRMAVGDLNGDGLPDVVINETQEPPGATIMLNDGAGGLLAATVAGTADPSSLALADLDGDGALDIVCGANRTEAYVLKNDGLGAFTAVALPEVRFNGLCTVAFDADGDGDSDIVFGGGDDRVAFLRNDGALVFTTAGQQRVQGDPPPYVDVLEDLAAADLDGDGRKELVAFSRAGNTFVAYYYDPLTGDFDRTPLKGFGDIAQGAFGELDGAPGIDAAVIRDWNGGVKALFNDGSGQFTVAADYRSPHHFPRAVAIGDWDADGANDFAFIDSQNGTVETWRNYGDATFRPRGSFFIDGSGDELVSVDMDADGFTDLVSMTSDTLVILRNCAGD